MLTGEHVLLERSRSGEDSHCEDPCDHHWPGVLADQSTPDLLSVDLIGPFVFDQQRSDLTVRRGAVLSNVVPIDEINRGTPKKSSNKRGEARMAREHRRSDLSPSRAIHGNCGYETI